MLIASTSPLLMATPSMSGGKVRQSTSVTGFTPAFFKAMAKKFLSTPATSPMPMRLPRRCPRLAMCADGAAMIRMQPACVPPVSRTSKPCSSGLIHRSTMPTAISALPVDSDASSASVVEPQLIRSTSRPCRMKNPSFTATGTAMWQSELGDQDSVSLRGVPIAGDGAAATRPASKAAVAKAPAPSSAARRPGGAAGEGRAVRGGRHARRFMAIDLPSCTMTGPKLRMRMGLSVTGILHKNLRNSIKSTIENHILAIVGCVSRRQVAAGWCAMSPAR
ncbi:protein of unknown function [Rhodovastum atsumiense]|nr:protein of unknown function [Rhodovastum atsumiense]